MKEVLIVLGSPNSATGELSSIAKSRLNSCADLFSKENSILCTGGWGSHFNTTKQPHAHYAQAYLMQKGVPKKCFLEFALSENTVDDAVKTKAILSKLKDRVSLSVITSDYHLERVKLIFSEILSGYMMTFIGTSNDVSEKELSVLLAHENKAIANILKNGLYY